MIFTKKHEEEQLYVFSKKIPTKLDVLINVIYSIKDRRYKIKAVEDSWCVFDGDILDDLIK